MPHCHSRWKASKQCINHKTYLNNWHHITHRPIADPVISPAELLPAVGKLVWRCVWNDCLCRKQSSPGELYSHLSTIFEVILLVKVQLWAEVLDAPLVRPDRGSNSWPPNHDSTFHVPEMPALTTWPSATSILVTGRSSLQKYSLVADGWW